MKIVGRKRKKGEKGGKDYFILSFTETRRFCLDGLIFDQVLELLCLRFNLGDLFVRVIFVLARNALECGAVGRTDDHERVVQVGK